MALVYGEVGATLGPPQAIEACGIPGSPAPVLRTATVTSSLFPASIWAGIVVDTTLPSRLVATV